MSQNFNRLNPSFARLLASENIRVRMGECKDAYFDLKHRELHVPLWGLSTEAVMDMVVGHEVGHALFTGAEGWTHGMEVEGITHSILNIIEDSRIEKLIQRKFPGLKRDFAQAYFYLHNELDLFSIRRVDVSKLSFADRYNLHFKVGPMSGAKFHNAEELAMVAEGQNLETWEDVISLAKKMQGYCDRNKSDPLLPQPKGQSEEKTLEEKLAEDAGFSEQKNDTPPPMEPELSGDEKDEEDSDEEEEDDLGLGGTPSTPKTGVDNTKDDADYSEAGITDKNLRENEKKLVESGGNQNSNHSYHQNVGKISWEHKEFERKYAPESDIRAVVSNNQKSIKEMVTEFERKKAAWQSINATPSRTGRLDTNRLAQYKTNPNIFLNKKVVQNAKSHGVVILLDNSGSMSEFWGSAKARAIEIAEFCSRVGIRCIVNTFTRRVLDTADANWRFLDGAFDRANHSYTPINRTLLGCEADIRKMYESGIQRCSLIIISDGEESDYNFSSEGRGRCITRKANFLDATVIYDTVTNISYSVPWPSGNWKNRREYWCLRSMQLHSIAIDMLKNRLGRQDLNVSLIYLCDQKQMRRSNKLFGRNKNEIYDNHGFNAIVRVPIKTMIRADVDHKLDQVKWEEISVRQRQREFAEAIGSAQGATFLYRVVAANIAKNFS
jgi:hypothetical protein